MNRLPALVADVKLALDNDLALVVGVGVDERGALLEPVKATADGLFRVGAADDVAEEGVVVGD